MRNPFKKELELFPIRLIAEFIGMTPNQKKTWGIGSAQKGLRQAQQTTIFDVTSWIQKPRIFGQIKAMGISYRSGINNRTLF